MSSSHNCPPHIKSLIQDIRTSQDTSKILKKYISFLGSDTTLFYIYINLGYSPEYGYFLKTPSQADVLIQINKEFQDPLQNELDFISSQTSALSGDSGNVIRQEFLKTFYENHIYDISEPNEIGLKEDNHETGSFTPVWNEKYSSPAPSARHEPSTPIYMQIQVDQNTPRMNRGLKVLSLRVKEIICQRGFSCYKEVADELIKEMDLSDDIDREKEEKNILRRVYDALNVLIACDVVRKRDGRYQWKGITDENRQGIGLNNSDQLQVLEQKREILRETANRFFAVRELIRRNKKKKKSSENIQCPFIFVAAEEQSNNRVNIEFNKSHTNLSINFQKDFKIISDFDILVKLDFHRPAYNRTDLPQELMSLISFRSPSKLMKQLIL